MRKCSVEDTSLARLKKSVDISETNSTVQNVFISDVPKGEGDVKIKGIAS